MTDDRRHDPALELLRDLDPKPTLSPQAKRRIAARIEDQVARSRLRWLGLAVPAVAALAFLAIPATRPAPAPASGEATQAFVVPACAVTRVADGGRFAAALVGPADAQVNGTGRRNVSLHAGRFIVHAKQQPVEVEAPDTRVTIAPASVAEIEVRELHTVRVALYSGSASVEMTATSSTFALTAGDSWNGRAVHPTELHDSTQATQILEPAAGAVELCPAPTSESPTTTAPRPTVPAATASRRANAGVAGPAAPALVAPSEPSPEPIAASRVAATESPSTGEARQLVEAIRRLRNDHDARGALSLLDMIQSSSAATFADEIALVRVEALLDLGDRAAALAVLDSLPLPDIPRGEELLVLRGDLRAGAKRWADAIGDYTRGTAAATPQLVERSLFGRASCRMGVGETAFARSELQDYLQRFPNGMFVAEARRLLAR